LSSVSEKCKWLHTQLEQLQPVRYPFCLEKLPKHGIYFFYEEEETWGHGGNKPRIVRVGTSKDDNFQSRIAEHYLLDDSKMGFTSLKSAPHDRSIFRKNIGRAILNKHEDSYLRTWETDFTSHENREKFASQRDIEKEKRIESEITQLLRNNFWFKCIKLDSQTPRMGKSGLEGALIGTLAQCPQCKASPNWLGRNSSKSQIREGKLWQIQHLKAQPITERDMETINIACSASLF
jgi:hypothetical protein